MIRRNCVCLIALFALAVTAGQTAASGQQKTATPAAKNKAASHVNAAPPAPQLERKAVEILKAASNRLTAAHTLKFTAVETFESLSRQGAPLVFGTKAEVTLQRPNKLCVILSGDGPRSEFYYDGKTVMAFAPAENLVAIADAPPTIDATLEKMYRTAAIYFPFTDLIVTDPYGDLAPGLNYAYHVGKSGIVGDTVTDIIAYAGDGVFAQIWIGVDDKLPRLIHAVYLDDPSQLRHNLVLSGWQLDSPVTADAFTLLKAANAKHMEFAHPHPEPAAGAKPSKSSPNPGN